MLPTFKWPVLTGTASRTMLSTSETSSTLAGSIVWHKVTTWPEEEAHQANSEFEFGLDMDRVCKFPPGFGRVGVQIHMKPLNAKPGVYQYKRFVCTMLSATRQPTEHTLN